jgi:hypothetical protein
VQPSNNRACVRKRRIAERIGLWGHRPWAADKWERGDLERVFWQKDSCLGKVPWFLGN